MRNGTKSDPLCVQFRIQGFGGVVLVNSKRVQRPVGHRRTQSSRATLSELVDSYQASGLYVLTREQALAALRVSDEALKKAAQRLVSKRRLAAIRRGFFVIVPVEYREAGAPPPPWFVDELMKFHGQSYYVGLLSAAALHGAANQQPQEFQIVTGEQIRATVAGRARLRFFRKRGIERTATMDMKTETGTLRVSTPEATALDLMRYLEASGHLGNVATVLAELAEKIEGRRLAAAARVEGSLSTAQRLGYLLEQAGAGEVGAKLADWIASLRPRFVPLRSDRPNRHGAKDDRWRVIVNGDIEVDP
jgi:predicted transcriptional regulator of viral defense system